jgi:hypothetical protein
MCAVLWLGCSTPAEQFADADKEVLGILKERQEQVLGGQQLADIKTPYSERKLEDIPPSEIILNRFASGTNIITLPQALDMAVKNSRDYQRERESVYLSALSLTGERHKFALKFSNANLDLERSRTTGNVNDTKSDAAFTLSKALKAGGTISASLVNDLTLYFDGSGPQVPGLTLALTKPLLNGAGQKMAQEMLTQAERDLVYSVRNFSRYQQTFLVDRFTEYVNLLEQKNRVRVQWELYQNRIRFREEQELRLQGIVGRL